MLGIVRRIALTIVALAVAGGAAAFASRRVQAPADPQAYVEMIVDYEAVPFADLVKRAELILVAQVDLIRAPRWNQDSGEYWEVAGTASQAMPYHEVVLAPQQVLVDPVGVAASEVVLTVLGGSRANAQIGQNDAGLSMGDLIVAFIEPGQIAWYTGAGSTSDPSVPGLPAGQTLKPVWRLIGVPRDAYLRQTAGGTFSFENRWDQTEAFKLAELTSLIAELRAEP